MRTWLVSLRTLAVLSALTGVVYPLVTTALASALFPFEAQGSLIERGHTCVGSRLIGQAFSDPGHFWSRPSATGDVPYDASASGGSNLGPSNPALTEAVARRIERLRAAGNAPSPVPADLVTASASGLDPHISPRAAEYQVARIARVRRVAPEVLRAMIARHTEPALLRHIGAARVNVVELNLDLDAHVP